MYGLLGSANISQNIEKIAFKVIQMTFLAIHITCQNVFIYLR